MRLDPARFDGVARVAPQPLADPGDLDPRPLARYRSGDVLVS